MLTAAVHFKHFVDNIIEIDHDSSTVQVRSSDQISDEIELHNEALQQQDLSSSSPWPDKLEEQDTEMSQALSNASRRVGDSSLYLLYAKEMGMLTVILFITASIGFCFFSRFPTIWLEWWSEAETRDPGKINARYMGGYAGFGVSATVSFFLSTGSSWLNLCLAHPFACTEGY